MCLADYKDMLNKQVNISDDTQTAFAEFPVELQSIITEEGIIKRLRAEIVGLERDLQRISTKDND